MSLCPAFRPRLRSLWHQFFGTIALMEFVLKSPCQQLCSFSLAPCQRSYACPMDQGLETLANLGRAVFRNNRVDEICPEKPVPTAAHFSCRSLHLCQRSYACPIAQCSHTAWQVLGTQFFGTMALMEFALKNTCQQLCSFILVLLPANEAICMSHRPMFAHRLTSLGLFRPNRSDGMCPENPYQQLYILTISLPPNGALPKLFPTVSPPSTLSSLPYRSFPTELFPGGFPSVPWCPVPWEAWTSWTDGKPWEIARG